MTAGKAGRRTCFWEADDVISLGCVEFEVLAGHPSGNVQCISGNEGLKFRLEVGVGGRNLGVTQSHWEWLRWPKYRVLRKKKRNLKPEP